MENFVYSTPTKIYFGKGQVTNISRVISGYDGKALLVCGGDSVKRNGIYDDVVKIFKENGVAWCELSGVEPNPRITTVREGVKPCREEGVEAVVPIGGGNTIDCAKAIVGIVSYDDGAWDTVLNPTKVANALLTVTVLTPSATGSETDAFTVISNLGTNGKIGTGHEDMRPKTSILDPSCTCSVLAYRTVVGMADITSYIFECYFSNVRGYMQDRMAEGLLKTYIGFGVRAVQDSEDYEAWANPTQTSSWAINNLIKPGETVEWAVHPMEYQLSTYHDITHGVRLVILTPHWTGYVLNGETVGEPKNYGVNVRGIDREKDLFEIAYGAIKKTKDYFATMGTPITIREMGVKDETSSDVMAEKATADPKGAYAELIRENVKNIYRAVLQVSYKDVKDVLIGNMEETCNI